MKKIVLVALGGLLTAATAGSGGAAAQCMWNGYSWSCPYAQPYAGYGQYGYGDPAFGYQPRGLGHPNGPEPGGGFRHMGQSEGHSD